MQKELLALIEKYKEEIVESDTWKEVCDRHDVDPNFIFLIPITFAKLDVSARTDNGVIYLNFRLLKDPDSIGSYVLHESVHWLQQCFGDGPTKGSNNSEDYLDNPSEQEGFKGQTSYIEETDGPEEAEAYIEKVLDHHDVPAKDKEERKKELLAIVQNIELNKEAGMFSFPQAPIDEITKTALDLFAAQVWARIEYYTDPYETDKVLLKNNEEIINECKKYTNAPAARLVGKGMFTIDFPKLVNDIYDWPYLKNTNLSVNDIISKLKSQKKRPWSDEITVYVYFTDNSATAMGKDSGMIVEGLFDPIAKILHIGAAAEVGVGFGEDKRIRKINNLADFLYKKDRVEGTIYHESLHLFQVLLYDIKSLTSGAGLPRRKRYEKREDIYGRPAMPIKKKHTYNELYEGIYAPIAEEFANSVKRFLRVIKRDVIRKEDDPSLKEDFPLNDLIRERAKAWVGFPNNFEEVAEKYNRSEREFSSPFFLRLEKEDLNKWKIIANSFLMAVVRKTDQTLQIEHPLRDIEFYPNLQDAVREFKFSSQNLPKDDIKLRQEFAKFFLQEPNSFIDMYLQYFQEDNEHDKAARQKLYKMHDEQPYDSYSMFAWLKEKDPAKWRKAIKEFMKAVGL